MGRAMQLVIRLDGSVRCVYGEEIDLTLLGALAFSRASHVEPDPRGNWHADLSLVGGPVLGPFTMRSQALVAEVQWLNGHLLPASR